MLSAQDNEMLTHVGPGTPMGELLRQYWAPALLSDELPGPDSPPVRIKLMCEELIAFRNTSGKVGLVANACPHRAASMFFGRNEEDGLRFGAVTYEDAIDPEMAQKAYPGPVEDLKYIVKDRAPRFLVRDTDFGCSYGAYRPADEGSRYYRTMHWAFPWVTMTPVIKMGN